jgi:hypothetical protein
MPRELENHHRTGLQPTLALWGCNTDGSAANGDTVIVLLLTLADISLGMLHSIVGLHPYAAPPIYLSS